MKLVALRLAIFASIFNASAVTKTHVSNDQIQTMCNEVYLQAKADGYTPELLIGLSRGGLAPLGFLAGELMFNNRNATTISPKLYNYDQKQAAPQLLIPIQFEVLKKFKSILIIDDIIDTGETASYVLDMLKSALPETEIKIAALFYKKSSKVKPDYYAAETTDWIVFPWEK